MTLPSQTSLISFTTLVFDHSASSLAYLFIVHLLIFDSKVQEYSVHGRDYHSDSEHRNCHQIAEV